LVRRIEDGIDLRPRHVIVDVGSLAPVADQTGIAQHHQVLRDVGLAITEGRLEVTDAGLAGA
jgi:hypothetical protein